MDLIPSPYNFVPLADKVFFPDWAEAVSMDVPFSDGISGTLTVHVTAKTPLYIRNGGAHSRDQTKRLSDVNYKDFFRANPGGPYAIPGTSLKGMLRAVVEIVSFGKIAGTKTRTAKVDDRRYAIRDLHNLDYTNHITEKICDKENTYYRAKVKTAWLSIGDDNKWKLHFCDMARVEQTDLVAAFEAAFPEAEGLGKTRQSAKEKYRLIPPGKKVPFDCGPEEDHSHARGIKLRYKKAENIGQGQTEGILVMTGQPAPRNGQPGRKHMEFIFFNRSNDSFSVPDEVKKDFIFAHTELGENRKANPEWEFWKEQLDQGKEVPVFVLMEGRHLSSMGLAMMYRLPYKHSIHEMIGHTSGDHLDGSRPDLAELIFGRVEDTAGLRGRAAVETFIAEGTPEPMEEVATVLSGPKPTYYPNYIKQDINKNTAEVKTYRTYMDGSAEIRGWKRYIVRKDGFSPRPAPAPSESVETRFRPLPAGTSFLGKIYLHNLRPQELGALIWAITWGGDSKLRHHLGMGKPYGYGSVSLSIEETDVAWCNPEKPGTPALPECLETFSRMMTDYLGQEWSTSANLAALKAMADPEHSWENELRYPQLRNERGNNEFVEHINQHRALLSPAEGSALSSKGSIGKNTGPSIIPPPPVLLPTKRTKKDLSPEELLLEEMGTLSMKELTKRLKNLDPELIDQDTRLKIAKKMEKFKGNAMFLPLLKQWKK